MGRHRQALPQDEFRGAGARAAAHAGLGEAHARAASPGARKLQEPRQGQGSPRQPARAVGRVPGAAAGGAPVAGAAGHGPEAPVSGTAPSLLRRLASMGYEAILLLGVGFFAAWLFFFASGGRDATQGWARHVLQLFILVVFAAYFLWCWLRGGQTLAMRTWRIRLVDVTPGRAILRFVLALFLLPLSIAWVLVDRDRQFLHDRLAG